MKLTLELSILDLQPRDKMCYAINGRHVGGKLCSKMAAARSVI